MPKHIVTHLPAPAPPPPAAPPPAQRLVVQLITLAGELMTVAVLAIGAVTVAGWLIAGSEIRSKERPRPSPPSSWVCWIDRHGEHSDRPPTRRHYARDGY